MKTLTSYVGEHKEEIVKPLLSVLKDELKRSARDVDGNITHIRKAAENGLQAMLKAQCDVGFSLDECLQLRNAIENEINSIEELPRQSKPDSIYGDQVLKSVYESLKDRGHVLDVLIIDDESGWLLGECKFAIRLFTTKMFVGQLTFYDGIERKFIDVIEMLERDNEPHSNERIVFVLQEHFQQCLRQFASLRLGDPAYPIAKEVYVLKTVGLTQPQL